MKSILQSGGHTGKHGSGSRSSGKSWKRSRRAWAFLLFLESAPGSCCLDCLYGLDGNRQQRPQKAPQGARTETNEEIC